MNALIPPKGRACLAIDPGRHSGIALVLPGPRRPILLHAEAVSGSTPHSLRRNLSAAALRALEHWDHAVHGKLLGVVEKPQGATRKRRDRSNVDTWIGIGRAIGIALVVLEDLPRGGPWSRFPLPREVRQREWTTHWRIPNGKHQDGEHRLVEARRCLDTSAVTLTSVDAAEAALLAGAVASGLKP